MLEADCRDDDWLARRLQELRATYFADVPPGYPIVAQFGIQARYRFGSIMAREGKSLIRVNTLFTDPFVPVFVIDATLAHELVHYAHGFGSGLPRRHANPHRGGVVDRELARRGLKELTEQADAWRREHWEAFYARRCARKLARQSALADAAGRLWEQWLCRPGYRTVDHLRARLVRLGACFGLPADRLPFDVAWLHASLRQKGLSYWFRREKTVRVHGLIADPRVPDAVLDFELAYWLACLTGGTSWPKWQRALQQAGLQNTAEVALRWRGRYWKRFCVQDHPLRSQAG
ncbi:MAG: hypothetical protein RMJ43_07680 [Chloroherpetonaceae bacterium]|nr:hypothetical protein [Chthonomonadaceae bacterium]MDW8207702.1 hypothetical protein [Chloroherpetonaceae bacterium]